MSKGLLGFAAFIVGISAVLSAPRGYLEPDLSRASESALENILAEGYGHFESGRLEEALEVFEATLEKWPESTEALQALGITCYRLDLYSRGVEAFEALAALKPDSASTLSRLGFTYSQLNLQREAIEAHSRAISLDPDLVTAHWGKGLAYKQQGYYEEAAKSFREVIRLRPDFAEAHYDLGEVCLNMKERCAAIEEYKVLRKIDKELADRLFDLIYK